MDLLNDYHPIYPPNPALSDLSDSDLSDNENYINTLLNLNNTRKRKRTFTFDEWSAVYSDELWHLWCIIDDFRKGSNLLNNLDFSNFCNLCYQNSTQ